MSLKENDGKPKINSGVRSAEIYDRATGESYGKADIIIDRPIIEKPPTDMGFELEVTIVSCNAHENSETREFCICGRGQELAERR